MKRESFLATAGKIWHQTGDGLLAVGLFAASLMAYLQTLAPSVATLFDDSLEFPLVASELGIAHPTGYPLYTLLGKLFTLGPWAGDVAQRNVGWAVNLLSAVAGALTVALVYLVARQLTRRRLPALLGSVALAVSPVFWSQSVIAEVYTLNSFFVAALLWLALRWAHQPLLPVTPFSLLQASPDWNRRAGPKEKPARFLPGEGAWRRVSLGVRQAVHHVYTLYRRFFPLVPPKRRLRLHPRIYALAALYGLSLTHHRTMLLLAPALIAFALLVEPRVLRRPALLGPEHPDRARWLQLAGRPIVLLITCFCVPLFLYLYLPLRGHVGSLDGTYVNSWGGFWRWVTASSYNLFLVDNPLARDLDAAFYAELFWQQFGPVGLALAVVGLVGLVRRPKALVLTAVAFVTYTAFAVVYRVPDVEVFFMPAFLVLAVWFAVGLDYAADLLRLRSRSLAWRRLLAVSAMLLFLAAILQPLVIAARNYPDVDMSRRWIVHDYGLYLLEQPLPSDSTIVGLLGEMTLVRYFQRTAGLRPDIGTVAADDEKARREAVGAALAGGGATYITRPLPGLAEDQALGAAIGMIDVAEDLETLIRVGKPDLQDPAVPRAADLAPVPGLQLMGYGVWEHRGHWEAWARLRLWWKAPEGLEEPLKISARVVDAAGVVVAATDAEPVSGAYPSAVWRPGEVVADVYEIPLPAGLPPGEYTPLIIVYEPDTGSERGRAELEPVYLDGNPVRPPRRALEAGIGKTVYARFGGVELLGYTAPSSEITHRPGETLPLTLLWQAWAQPALSSAEGPGLSQVEGPASERRVVFWLEGDGQYLLGEQIMGGPFPSGKWQDRQTVRQWLDLRVPADTPPGTWRLKMRVIRDGRPIPWGRWLFPMGSDLDLGVVQVGP
ncbi:protein O-mannosyl-transferase family [Chloroflexota bacterium]